MEPLAAVWNIHDRLLFHPSVSDKLPALSVQLQSCDEVLCLVEVSVRKTGENLLSKIHNGMGGSQRYKVNNAT